MHIQVNSDNQTDIGADVAERVEASIRDQLARFGDRLTRVEVHLGDRNGPKAGPDDKRCLIEARPNGLDPIAVTADAATIERAVAGATDKLITAIDRTLGKRTTRKGH